MGQASPYTLTHEVGHNLSLRHAPCGGPEGIDPAFPHRDGGIGHWGYDFRFGSTLSPDRSKDIMSYCRTSPWISGYHFGKVIDHRAELAGDAARARLAGAAAAPPTDVLVLWGGVADGEIVLEPAYPMRARPILPEEAGPYRIRGVGAGGRTLLALDFTPGEDAYGDRHFVFMVPIEPEWEESLERIVLTGPEGRVVAERDGGLAVTVVTERGTGRIRAILRDWEGAPPGVLGRVDGLEVRTTRGVGEAVRLRR